MISTPDFYENLNSLIDAIAYYTRLPSEAGFRAHLSAMENIIYFQNKIEEQYEEMKRQAYGGN